MADDDSGEKTEPASAKKKMDARKKGTVLRSTDLSTAAIMLTVVIVFWFYGPTLINELGHLMQLVFANLHNIEVNSTNTVAYGSRGLLRMIIVLAPLMLAVLVVGLVVNIAQVGWFFSFEPLAWQWSKLDPVKGLKNIFGLNGWVKLIQSLMKMVAIGTVLVWTLKDEFPRMGMLMDMHVVEIMAHMGSVTFVLALRTALMLLVIGVIDYFYQRWKYEKDLRMSKQEVKEEMRMMEGDPQIKQRRRKIQLEMALKRMMGEVPEADVVITNPTHLALAIRYDIEQGVAPRVVAKGADFLAERIRAVALEHDVPIVEKQQLAQALYAAVEIGDYVPEELWLAVAEILAYVYRLSGKVAS